MHAADILPVKDIKAEGWITFTTEDIVMEDATDILPVNDIKEEGWITFTTEDIVMEDATDTLPVKDIKEEGWITFTTEDIVKDIKEEDEPIVKTEPIEIEPGPVAIKTSPNHARTSPTSYPGSSSSIVPLGAEPVKPCPLHDLIWHDHQSDSGSIGNMTIHIKETGSCKRSLFFFP